MLSPEPVDRPCRIAARLAQMPLQLAQMIQAGLPVMSFSSQPQLVDEVSWEERIGNSLVVREPVGVVGAITPWNYTLHQICAKVAPALSAGCTIVLKPSEYATFAVLRLARLIAEESWLPEGVLNVVTGPGEPTA